MPRRSSVAVLGAPTNADAICHISQSLRTADPRTDIVNDSAAWSQLLLIAVGALGEDDALFGVLLGLRACGAGLQCAPDGAWRITAGEMDSGRDGQPGVRGRSRTVADAEETRSCPSSATTCERGI